MGQEAEDRKQALIERIAQTMAADEAEFTRVLYRGLAPADLLAIDPADLRAAAAGLWAFAAQRPAGAPLVRIYQPDHDVHGYTSPGLVAELVNDDMPFLVDSVTAAIIQADLSVDLVIHPVARVERDTDGRRIGFGAGKPESVMHLRLSGIKDADGLKQLEDALRHVLADVRAAVHDWRAMRAKAGYLAVEMQAMTPAGIEPAELAEAKLFLDWLVDNHFTFLGYREYAFDSADPEAEMTVVPGSGLGILLDPTVPVFDFARNLREAGPQIRAYMQAPELIVAAKSTRKSTVHRSVLMDVISVRKLDDDGRVVAERRFVGLFTSSAYNQNAREIPAIRRKIDQVLARAGLNPTSHDGKALVHILDTYPRDELFQITADALFDTAIGILRLQDRHRIALFVRRDPFERFISCLIYVPQDRFDASLRYRFFRILMDAYNATVSTFAIQMVDSPLTRLHVILSTTPGAVPEVDAAQLEAKLIEAGRSWPDQLTQAAVARHGQAGFALARRFAQAFPTAYREAFTPATAIDDIALIDSATEALPAVALYRRPDAGPAEFGAKIVKVDSPVHLSDVLPMLENRGLRVLTEHEYAIAQGGGTAWLHDFFVIAADGPAIDLGRVGQLFAQGFRATWAGLAESDGFDRLTLAAALPWREVALLRAFAKYLKQAGFTYSQAYIEATLARHADVAAAIVRLFAIRFDPAYQGDRSVDAAGVAVEIEHRLDQVTVLDEDRILRRYVNLVDATLRTNFYQSGPEGPKSYISFKLDSRKVAELPKPRPHVEVWVYAPDTEAIHLRGGPVARGGIRWSDRREDFRTEVLGLMKAQNVKNAVIVPVGSKGGFVVKKLPPPEAGRAAIQAQVVESYKTLMRGLLDITDNRRGGAIVPPADVVRHDGSDPYLVVAADKGTATFSDIANGVAHDYGFWLDDAFASGGSVGYDHKALAITARGAWVAVERHFRELGVDLGRETIRVVGIGDMAGDVFGNGLLHSDRLKLIGAFNHLHVFLDPDPDAKASFAERKRLFTTPGTTWKDYDPAKISAGGGVFERSAKAIKLTPEVCDALGIEPRDVTTPGELIQCLLRAPVDLIWFGGIGTFIKATTETNADAGDRANDTLRIDATELRARVIGEGANLGVTQRGRIEVARLGVRIDTDAIDNSAGVDMSDHEVNIKILLSDPVAHGGLSMPERNAVLASMAVEVSDQVLRDNYLQTLALSMAERQGIELVDPIRRMMDRLEHEIGLDRAIEFLPTDAQLDSRRSAGQGLTRPELSVLLAYAKMALDRQLAGSALLDDPALEDDLAGYFPHVLQERYPAEIRRHGLRRPIIATLLTNQVVNRCGLTFVSDMERELGLPPDRVVGSFVVVRTLLDLPPLWQALEGLDADVATGTLPAAAQIDLFLKVAAATAAAVRWFGQHGDPAATIGAQIDRYGSSLRRLVARLAARAPAEDLATQVERIGLVARNLDILRLAQDASVDVEAAGDSFFEAGERFGIGTLVGLARGVPTPDSWSRQALSGFLDDLAGHQTRLALHLMNGRDSWLDRHREQLTRLDRLVDDLQVGGSPDLARLAVAERALRILVEEGR